MAQDRNLDDVYGISSQDELRELYRKWAHSYDSGFSEAQGYQLPREVAQAYVGAGGVGPVLDIGAGTGLVAEHLQRSGIKLIDGLDLSEDMLGVAMMKGIYQKVMALDITALSDNALPIYNGVVSAGTFTMGHVGPVGLAPMLRFAAKDALFVISVNAAHFAGAGFEAEIQRLSPQIKGLTLTDVRIFDDRADKDHRNDKARLMIFRKA